MYAIEILNNTSWVAVHSSSHLGEGVKSAKLVQSSNSIGSLTLSVLPTFAKRDLFTVNARVRARDEVTGDYVFYGRVIDATPQMDTDGTIYTEVTCEDALGFLQDTAVWIDSRKGYFEGNNKTYPVEIDEDDETRTIKSADLLSILIAQHNSTVGDHHGSKWKKVSKGDIDVDTDDDTTFDAEYQATTYEMLQDLAEDADWEYRSRYDGSTVYIDAAEKLGSTGGTFKVGDNMASAALKTTMADVATRCFPYGVEYAKLKKTSRKGTKVTGRVKGDDFESKGTMLRFAVDDSIKCVLKVAQRKDGYAMVLFTNRLLTSKNVEKAVVKKYTAGVDSSETATKRYPVPEDAKYVYVMGAGSECTTYGYQRNSDGVAIGKNYRTDLGYWKKKLTDAQLSKILDRYGVTMGSVVDGSGDRSYYLSKNEDLYGVIEYSPVKTQSLKTDRITDSSKAVYSIDDLKGANAKKAKAFVKWACRKLKKKCVESCELTVTGYDLKEAGLAYDALKLYDTWQVVNELAGINASAEVVRVERDLLEPWSVTVELGSKVTRSSASTRESNLTGAGSDNGSGYDDDSAADEYATLVGQYADAAEAAATEAVEKADELDSLSRRIQVDSLAAGQMASEAYDTVSPITEAMKSALDATEQQAHELTAVKESDSKTVEVVNSLAKAVATYSYETEKSVVAWRQTYTASQDAWAADDEETQAKIKAAYAKLYGDGGTADAPTEDSAQGKLNAAKAANVTAAQTEAQMQRELASAKAYQTSCNTTLTAQQAAYDKALANYNALKKKTTVKKRQIDAAWTALQASIARRDEAQAAVTEADARVSEAETNYAAAQAALATAEQQVADAAAEVETAMEGIHEVYSSCIEQTAKGIKSTVTRTDALETRCSTIEQTCSSISSTVSSKIGASEAKTICTQTLQGWTWKIENSDAAAYMSFTNTGGTGTLTLGGSASAIVMGGSSSTITMGGSSSTINIGAAKITGSSDNITIMPTTATGSAGLFISSSGLKIGSSTGGTTAGTLNCGDIGCDAISATSLATNGYINASDDVKTDGRFYSSGANTGTGTTAVWYNNYLRVSSGSSERYKHDIADVTDETLDPAKLYDIPVRQFVFNDGYLAEDDEYVGRTVIGLIAEEVAEHYPIAAYHNADGQVENWEARYIIPPMLALIQQQKALIDDLTARIEKLEGGAK